MARKVLGDDVRIRGYLVQIGGDPIDRSAFDPDEIGKNPFFCPDAEAAARF